jgi:hypothetical protein
MTRRPWRLAERAYGLLVDLYPEAFRKEYGPSMKQAFRDLLDDPDMPRSRIFLSVVCDLSSSLFQEHLANLTGGRPMTRSWLPAGALRVAMLVVLVGAVPIATGAAGYYVGRSQPQPVAEPTPSQPLYRGQFFWAAGDGKWRTVVGVGCPVAIAPGITATFFVTMTDLNTPLCPNTP